MKRLIIEIDDDKKTHTITVEGFSVWELLGVVEGYRARLRLLVLQSIKATDDDLIEKEAKEKK